MSTTFLDKIVAYKNKEVHEARTRIPENRLLEAAGAVKDRLSLASVLEGSGVNIIAEIKRASPSKGLFRPNLDAAQLATSYEDAGASAISVLTDHQFFQGSPEDLMAAKQATGLPILRKDFLVSSYQVVEAAAWGADAVLLIARTMSLGRCS